MLGLSPPPSFPHTLGRLADLMEQHQEELATIEALDAGAVYTLALKTHVGMSIQTFRYFAGWCDKIQVGAGSCSPRESSHRWAGLVMNSKSSTLVCMLHNKLPQFSGLKQHHSSAFGSAGGKSGWAQVGSMPRSHSVDVKVRAGPYPEALWETPLPGPFRCWQSSVLMGAGLWS